MHPKKIIALAFVLVLFGFLAPLLMVLKVIETSFALSFLSHVASVSGLLLGIIGAAWYSRRGRS
ncbi:MAG: hypothetical protein FJ014_06190 [Chloroflexi bacterium]|nr:hypothetical protein [Chloroflexota bacterium]